MFWFSSLQKIEADNHQLQGFQCTVVHQLFSWVYDHYSVFFCQGTIKIAFSYFSRDYYLSPCTFSFTSNSTGGNVLFCSLQRIEADNHWLTRLPTQCTNSSAGFMTTTRFFFCQGTIKIAFSYFSHDYYFSAYTFSFTRSSTGGECFFSQPAKKLKQIIIGSQGFQRSAPTLQLGL